ncbi:MAG TPA: hypothetical protein VN259_02030 [Xanthomonadales bacterium]|nr:hypothetical protein [Xanthomonadales bacterium]
MSDDFDDPSGGLDRRAQLYGDGAVGRDDEKRALSERRVFRQTRTNKPWWLMRRYVSAEKFHAHGSFS